IIGGDDLVFKHIVYGFSIDIILQFLILKYSFLWQRPAGKGTITFNPPAVEYAEMESPVHNCFLAACSRCLKRTSRCVEPDIHSLYKVFCHLNVIVFKENYLPCKLRHLRNFKNALYKILTSPV